mgnify:FL=1|jgi:hypothetical protein|tara:strand:+ start:574 stop:975 length:402 start_codon:yes stop_codon:yes gene_type:complete
MSASNITLTQKGNVVTLSGPDMTSSLGQMKGECVGRYANFIFGDAKGVVDKLKSRGDSCMSVSQLNHLFKNGTSKSYYTNIYCYFCVNKNNYSNYLFSPEDGENRDNDYFRLRSGVIHFANDENFEIWIINCA